MTSDNTIGCPLAVELLLHYGRRTDEPFGNQEAPAVIQETERLWELGALKVAVVTVTSDEVLEPGTRVSLVEGSTDKVQYLAALSGTEIGIVDPFLRTAVKPEYVLHDHQLDSDWRNQDEEIKDEDWGVFWEHFRTLTGMSIKDKDKEFVVCCPT